MTEDQIRARLLTAFMEGISVLELGKLPDEIAQRVDKLIDKAVELVKTEEKTSDYKPLFRDIKAKSKAYNVEFNAFGIDGSADYAVPIGEIEKLERKYR